MERPTPLLTAVTVPIDLQPYKNPGKGNLAGENKRDEEQKQRGTKQRARTEQKKNTKKRTKSKGEKQRGVLALPLLSSLQTKKDPESKQIHSRSASSSSSRLQKMRRKQKENAYK
jgi:hypothetical protein